MPYQIRDATDADEPFLRALHHAAWRPLVEQLWGWDEAKQDRHFATTYRAHDWQIILLNGDPVGTFALREEADHLFLSEIWILPAFQGHGLGAAVIGDLIAEANRRRLPLRLQVLKHNLARRLYLRLGFRPTGQTATHIQLEHPLESE